MNKYSIALLILYLNEIFAFKNSTPNIKKTSVRTPSEPPRAMRRVFSKVPNNENTNTFYEHQSRERSLNRVRTTSKLNTKSDGQMKTVPKANGQMSTVPKSEGKPITVQRQRQLLSRTPKTHKNADFDLFKGMNLTASERNFSLLDERMDENFLKKIERFDEVLTKFTNEKAPNDMDNLPKNNAKKDLIVRNLSENNETSNLEEHKSNPFLLSKIFHFVSGWKKRAHNVKQQKLKSQKEREGNVSDSINSEDDELSSQLSEKEEKFLMNLAPEPKQISFFKAKDSKNSNKLDEEIMEGKISKELENYHGLLLRLFKIKFKQLINQNDKFVEEMLTKEWVIELVEKYLPKLTL